MLSKIAAEPLYNPDANSCDNRDTLTQNSPFLPRDARSASAVLVS